MLRITVSITVHGEGVPESASQTTGINAGIGKDAETGELTVAALLADGWSVDRPLEYDQAKEVRDLEEGASE